MPRSLLRCRRDFYCYTLSLGPWAATTATSKALSRHCLQGHDSYVHLVAVIELVYVSKIELISVMCFITFKGS